MRACAAGSLAMVLILCVSCRREPVRPAVATAAIEDGTDTVLTSENFARIRQFILDQGRRATYCNMYNNNPYFPFTGFAMYLNPTDQRNINCEIGKSEFPTLVVRTRGPGPNRSWYVHLSKDDGRLRIVQHYAKTPRGVLRQEVTAFFQTALAEIRALRAGAGR